MRGRSWWPAAVAAVATLSMVTGCGAATGSGPRSATTRTGSSGSTAAMSRCGTARTAAGVPVEIEVSRGDVACTDALAVEREYARDLASGKVRGNGGGAPVTVRGWTCQGFNTPEVLATGNASACHKGSAQILAVLPPATSSASPAPGS